MKEKIINLSDIQKYKDKIVGLGDLGSPKRTRIIICDADTGEIFNEEENKIVITGSTVAASKLFGVSCPIKIPTYNTEMNLQNSVDYTQSRGDSIVCLFCVDDSGCGSTESDVYTVGYTDRISPDTIMPFRYVDADNDINEDLRKYYFGRRIEDNKIAYYFKTFESEPQMHLRYADGTQITENFYDDNTTQLAECYVECKLKINRNDFRDYFEQVLGWDKARVSSLSLCYSWYRDDLEGNYKWYQDILPYTKLNFPFEKLVSLDRAIIFYYQIFY